MFNCVIVIYMRHYSQHMHVVNTWVTEWSPIKTRFDIFVIPQFDHRCDDLAKELAAAQPCQSHSWPGQICAENLEQNATEKQANANHSIRYPQWYFQDPSLAVEMKNWEPRLGIAEDAWKETTLPTGKKKVWKLIDHRKSGHKWTGFP